MTRVLLISPSPIKGGAEGYAMKIALEASERGWDVHMALPMAPGTRTMRDDLVRAGIAVVALPRTDDYDTGVPAPRKTQCRAAARIASMVWRLDPDVVHLTSPWPCFALSSQLATALIGTPSVVVFQLVPDPVPLATKAVIYRLMHRRRQAWVTVSRHGRHLIASAARLSPDQVEVIHNGAAIVSATEGPTAQLRHSVRSELGLSSDARLVISVGRLHEQKRHRDLIEAFEPLCQTDPGVHLLIAGEGEEEHALRTQAQSAEIADSVHLLGRRADVRRLLDAADLFAFASSFEGLPFSVVEAMSSGLPVVSANFPGAEEIIQNGRDGVLVPVGDVEALRAALARLLGDPEGRTRLGESARVRSADFSERAMLDRTLGLLTTMAAAKPRRSWAWRGQRRPSTG